MHLVDSAGRATTRCVTSVSNQPTALTHHGAPFRGCLSTAAVPDADYRRLFSLRGDAPRSPVALSKSRTVSDGAKLGRAVLLAGRAELPQ
jgi:hypothetical protein